ncbi:hypothetical protein GMORB2_1027 [Geosmithia morbida]|uniref:Uncharacterized protein n=1 Tax=Geosmithia morbida TaxID=1094350 RepID=A0A9P4Z1N6_9HYPO|nr:uncharacterized protein GMORB2_1027 [Geosmithia morbida]KAF4125782.1 hypothetical protein GMORB2_1027 [Geosmithia morbida]
MAAAQPHVTAQIQPRHYSQPDEGLSVPVSSQSHKRVVSAPPGTVLNSAVPNHVYSGHHGSRYGSITSEPAELRVMEHARASEPGVSSSPSMSPAAEATIHVRHHDGPSVIRSSPDSPEAAVSSGSQPSPLRCMYTENCDTNAQPRKVITHFFGRNKSCTMMIPPEVWVHYCRKHYQRVRYRNFENFPLVQIDLVRTQVERIDAWSRDNQHRNSSSGSGEPGRSRRYVKAWTLALRKREQRRLGSRGGGSASDASAATAAVAAAAEDDSTEESTSAPQWIRQSVGNGYTTGQILSIVERLKDELVAEALDAIPDIEFLPEIFDESLEVPGGGAGPGSTGRNRSSSARSASGATTTRKYNKRKSSDSMAASDKRPRMTADEAYTPHSTMVYPEHQSYQPQYRTGSGGGHYVLGGGDEHAWRAPSAHVYHHQDQHHATPRETSVPRLPFNDLHRCCQVCGLAKGAPSAT